MNRMFTSMAVAATVMAASWGAAAQTVGFATLPEGAINNLQAKVMANVVQTHSNLQMRVIPVGGSSATLAAVQTGDAEFTIGDVQNAIDAFQGNQGFPQPSPDLRIVLTVQVFPIGIMVRNDSDIKTVADLKGKKFPTGWQQFPAGIPLSNAILATAGLSLDDVDPVPSSGLIPAADDFKIGKTVGTTIALVAPKVAEVNAAIPGGVRFLSVEDGQAALDKVHTVRQGYGLTVIQPGGPYVGIHGPTRVLGIPLVITSSKNVSDDIVYKFTKAIAENKAELVKGHPSFNGFFPDKRMSATYPFMNVHPGAIKYYKEKGIWEGK